MFFSFFGTTIQHYLDNMQYNTEYYLITLLSKIKIK